MPPMAYGVNGYTAFLLDLAKQYIELQQFYISKVPLFKLISRRLILNLSWSWTRPAEPGDSIFSELNWADIWADLSFYWSERAETFRADPNKTHDKIQIKNKMSNPSQEPPVSSKAPNKDLKDMNVLCTFKFTIES